MPIRIIADSMADDQREDDEDEGFVLHKVEIKEKIPSQTATPQSRPIDFLPRYICGDRLLRKQPPSLHHSFTMLQETLSENAVMPKKAKAQVKHPYEKYFSSSDYSLTYFKSSKERTVINTRSDSFSQHEVSLTSISVYSQQNYSLLKNYDTNCSNNDLEFDSKFECGNLQLALRSNLTPRNYILFMQNDTNTNGYNRWFYFSVKNAEAGKEYTFKIVNFRKGFPFFNEGLKPVNFSIKDGHWRRDARDVRIKKSSLTKIDCDQNMYYTLSFSIVFPHDRDINFLAIGLPYSYTKLMTTLQEMQKTHLHQLRFELNTIAYSLSNNQVPYLNLTSKSAKNKQVILLLARQHPGETVSSFLMESFLQQLLSSKPESEWLLDNFIFKIFPMVNVDGVIYGNFRCDLSGMDLNRNWKNPSKILHPQIYAIKEEIEKISAEYSIACCLDFHGHSKNYNVFCYSCKQDNQSCRVLPYMFSQISPIFKFASCTFGISKDKEATARATIFRTIKNFNILTIESSFFGSNIEGRRQLFVPNSFDVISSALISGLKSYLKKDPMRTEVEAFISQQIDELMDLPRNQENDSGSDSDPQCDQIEISQKLGHVFPNFIPNLSEMTIRKPKRTINKKINKLKDKSAVFNNPQRFEERESIEKVVISKPAETNLRQTGISKKIFLQTKRENKYFQKKKNLKNFQKSLDLRPFLTVDTEKTKKVTKLNALRRNINSSELQLQEFISETQKANPAQKEKASYSFQYHLDRKEDDELPLLCILSDKKKKMQIEKRRKNQEERQRQTMTLELTQHPSNRRSDPAAAKANIHTVIATQQPALIIHKKKDIPERIREKQKDAGDLLSAIWRENFLRASQQSRKHVFM